MTNMQPNFTVEEENEALISFLRADYDDALEQIRVLKSDVNELIDILRKHSIEVPVHIQERIQLDTPLAIQIHRQEEIGRASCRERV